MPVVQPQRDHALRRVIVEIIFKIVIYKYLIFVFLNVNFEASLTNQNKLGYIYTKYFF